MCGHPDLHSGRWWAERCQRRNDESRCCERQDERPQRGPGSRADMRSHGLSQASRRLEGQRARLECGLTRPGRPVVDSAHSATGCGRTTSCGQRIPPLMGRVGVLCERARAWGAMPWRASALRWGPSGLLTLTTLVFALGPHLNAGALISCIECRQSRREGWPIWRVSTAGICLAGVSASSIDSQPARPGHASVNLPKAGSDPPRHLRQHRHAGGR